MPILISQIATEINQNEQVAFEKALAQINGAYPIVNREFARRIRAACPEIRFLNREDDMGLEGLRRAKESYFPDLLLEKTVAEAL